MTKNEHKKVFASAPKAPQNRHFTKSSSPHNADTFLVTAKRVREGLLYFLQFNPSEVERTGKAVTFAATHFDSTNILCPVLFMIPVPASVPWSNNLNRRINHN
jgi:hypothetical protein